MMGEEIRELDNYCWTTTLEREVAGQWQCAQKKQNILITAFSHVTCHRYDHS